MSSETDQDLAEEKMGEDESVIVGKTRDGEGFFQAFHNIQEQKEDKNRKEREERRLTIKPTKIDDKVLEKICQSPPKVYFNCSPIQLKEYQIKGNIPRVIEYSGSDYFAKLDESWSLISRADMTLANSESTLPPLPPPPVVVEVNHHFDSSFPGLLSLDSKEELDLRDRTLSNSKLKEYFPKSQAITLVELGDRRNYFIDHFTKFLECHNQHQNKLHLISFGILYSFLFPFD